MNLSISYSLVPEADERADKALGSALSILSLIQLTSASGDAVTAVGLDARGDSFGERIIPSRSGEQSVHQSRPTDAQGIIVLCREDDGHALPAHGDSLWSLGAGVLHDLGQVVPGVP